MSSHSAPGLRVLYVLRRLELYHPARLQALAEQLKIARNGRLLVVQLTQEPGAHPVRLASTGGIFESVTAQVPNGNRAGREAGERLGSFQPDVAVLTGYSPKEMRNWARWAQRQRLGTILVCPSQRRDKKRHLVVEMLKGRWIRSTYDAAFVGGERATHYLRTLGFPEARVWRGYNVVDNERYGRASGLETSNTACPTSDRDGTGYFLFVGRLAKEKNIDMAVRAFARALKTVGSPLQFVVAGSGPERERLGGLVKGLGIADHVSFLGYIAPERLPEVYHGALALILPSKSEPWGLVINEAMAAGLPVLASTYCGAVPELVRPGVTGWTFEPSDVEELALHISRLALNPAQARSMGAAAQSLVSAYTPQSWALALTDCISWVSKDREALA